MVRLGGGMGYRRFGWYPGMGKFFIFKFNCLVLTTTTFLIF